MKCDMCGMRAVEIRVKQMIGKKSREVKLCGSCADELGIETRRKDIPPDVNDIVSGVLSPVGVFGEVVDQCPECGTTIRDLRRTGQVGCPACYGAFKTHIAGLLRRTRATPHHRGKVPERLATFKTIFVDKQALRTRLTEALSGEKYEEAAKIRDELRGLEHE